jgi:hypothetical protein
MNVHVVFHLSINEIFLLMSIAINLQLMYYQIILLQLMDFDNGIMLQLESISVILNYNLSIC